MISFREIGYMGRLGNQMFQFASTVGIARKVGTDPRFPIENCVSFQQTGPFDPKTGTNMPVKCELLDGFQIPSEMFIPLRHIRAEQLYREPDFTFDPHSFGLPPFTAVNGYFQTEKYFHHCADEVRKIFSFKPQTEEKALSYFQTLKEKAGKEICSLHVRRGDYLQMPDHHPPCSADYYNQATRKMKSETGCVFLVFSDDRDWCQSHFVGEDFIVCDLADPFQELCCMSLCDHHIIANSSFSWWGAWLNPKDSKKVIAPGRWFGPLLNKNVSDVYLPNWFKI